MTEGIEYEVLHYRGDVTASDDCQPGRLLGVNEFGRPWQVIDAEYGTSDPWGHSPRTTVHLQTASPEAVVAAFRRSEMVRQPQREPRHVRRQRLRAEGKL